MHASTCCTPNQQLFTHKNPDNDAMLSSASVMIFRPEIDWRISFVNASFDGKGMCPGDMAVDVSVPENLIPDGCTVIKGRHNDGLVGSAFASVMNRYATPAVVSAMAPFIDMIDIEDSQGKSIKRMTWPHADEDQTNVLYFTSFFGVINCLGRKLQRQSHKTGRMFRSDIQVIKAVKDILEGYIKLSSQVKLGDETNVAGLSKMLRVWAARKFVPGCENVHTWDMPEGLGNFSDIVQEYASTDDQQALREVLTYVSERERYGNIWRRTNPELSDDQVYMLRAISWENILNALILQTGFDTLFKRQRVFERMCLIFDGHHEIRLGHLRKIRQYEANPDQFFNIPDTDYPVAITSSGDKFLSYYLYTRLGVKVVVYQDGNNMGITCDNGPWGLTQFRMDDPRISAVFDAVGEDSFKHEAGFLQCWGTRKSPKKVPSRACAEDLAKAAIELCQQHSVLFD